MNQQLRFILFVVISVVILGTWSAFFGPKPTPPGEQAVATDTRTGAAATAVTAVTGSAPAVVPTPPSTDAAAGAAVPAAPVEPEPPLATTRIETPLWTAEFSSQGGALRSFVLAGDKQRAHLSQKGSPQTQLVHPAPGQPLPLSVDVAGATGQTLFNVSEPAPGRLVYQRRVGDTLVTKTFSYDRDSYALRLDVEARRDNGAAVEGVAKLAYPAWESAPGTSGLFGGGEVHQGTCYRAGERSMETRPYRKDAADTLQLDGAAFASLDEKYFVAALAPREGSLPAVCTVATPGDNKLEAALTLPLAAQDGASRAGFDLYLGPKSVERLAQWGHGAEVSIYDGSIAKVGKLLVPVLKAFHAFSGNWGVAIILLTILVKLITFPLAQKQMVSMEKMRLVGPKLEEVKRRYESDPQRMNVETMRIYQEEGINPIGCAVPMLVQMPIWWALYSSLQNSFELYNEPFFGWVRDLTAADPFYVLPVLMTASMLVTQILTPQSAQAQQMKAMTYGMPVFFGFLMASLPAGLVLYIFVNNLLSIAHSAWFRRRARGAGPQTA